METTEIKLHPKQYDAYASAARYTAVVCGVQSGKTFLGTVWAGTKMDEFPEGNGLIAAPTYKVLQQSTLEKFFQTWPEWRKYYKQQQGVIELPTGGRVFIRSADEPLGLEGMTLDWAWLDEAGMMARLVWTVIRARVAIRQGKVLITTTPYALNWLYTDVFEPWKVGTDKDIAFHTWRSVDNPYFPVAEVEKERTRLSPAEFSRRYEGEFTKMEGLVWDLPSSAILDMNASLERTLKFPDATIAGVDWGFRNPSAIVVLKIKDGAYYLVEEWKEEGKTTPEIIQQAKGIEARHRIKIWYPDPAEQDRVEEFQRSGLRCGQTNKDVALGLSYVGSLMREGRFFVLKSCAMFLDEVAKYHYAEAADGKPLKEEPVKDNDHLCFAAGTIVDGVPIEKIGVQTGERDVYDYEVGGVIVTATSEHPVLTQRGLVPIDTLRYDDLVWSHHSFKMVSGGTVGLDRVRGLIAFTFWLLVRHMKAVGRDFTDTFGARPTVQSLLATSSIIGTGTLSTIRWTISCALTVARTCVNTWQLRKGWLSLERTSKKQFSQPLFGLVPSAAAYGAGRLDLGTLTSCITVPLFQGRATSVGNSTLPKRRSGVDSAITTAVKKRYVGRVPVWALRTLSGMYRANGLLVGNCDAARYACMGYKVTSPTPAKIIRGTGILVRAMLDGDGRDTPKRSFPFV